MRRGHDTPIGDPLTRHEDARRELSSTSIAPATAWGLVAAFLALLASMPALDATGVPALVRASFPGGQSSTATVDGTWGRVVRTNRDVLSGLRAFERSLEQASRLAQWLRPPTQAFLTGRLGAGNERVYPGLDGWLFYRTDVDHVTGPGFLDDSVLRRRVRSASEWDAPPAPDPRPAIRRFAGDLAARGITLVLVPVPVKPGVHPEQLAPEAASSGEVLHNRSYAALVDELRRSDVLVFDPSPILSSARPAAPQYLKTDTHWRPEAMEAVALELAAFIRANVILPEASTSAPVIERVEIQHTGDTARMLDLAEGDTLYPPENAFLRRVLRPDGTPWTSTRGAPVLLVGDSFSNIYSLESMGWGTSAGLAEQLSDALLLPLDRIVQNDAGARATRDILQRDPGRLAGTHVVVWQFAVRELSFGDWTILPIPPR